MSVIEGIGDEVVQFFSVVLIVVLAVAAWWSTSIRENHHSIRTVLILERRSRNRSNVEPTQSQPTVTEIDNSIDTGQQDSSDGVETEMLTDENQDKDENDVAGTAISEQQTPSQSSIAVETSSAAAGSVTEVRELRNLEESRSEGNLKKLFKTQAATILSGATQDTREPEDNTGDRDQIRIRLKYLNDDQKLVKGRLQEQLGEFKRRHFSIELSADKLVRLIFNGQVLGSDQQTLQACGLYDNCVVHCLVHNQRMASRSPAAAPQPNASPPDWNLSTLLYACLSVVLCLVWYCRYQYAQLFTLTTTAALIGLTGIFSVSILSLYFPDQDGIPH